MIKFSCLVSVYAGTNLDFFKEAISSVINQTVQPAEIIIVRDGPVNKALEDYLQELAGATEQPETRLIKIEQNIGAGPARNKAIAEAQYEWIAIMDCDDYALPNRFEKQIAVLDKHPDVDFISTLSDEYEDNFSPENFIATKKCPETSAQIKKRLNYNCCVTNPTIFFKKQVWEKTEGYASFRFLNEDHFFFLKAAKHDFRFYCVQEALIKVRIGREQRKRRSGFKLFWTDVKFRTHCFQNELMDFKGFSIIFLLLIRRFTPGFVLAYMHRVWRSI